MADILLVEDDKDLAWAFQQLLDIDGHTVRIANDGEAALRLLKERAPNLVVTDIEMPILDGPGMAYRIFIEDSGLEEIPIVVLSGFPELERVAKEIGTPYFVSKPFNIDNVLALIDRALVEKTIPRRIK